MNTKQKLSMYAAIGFLAVAAFCAIEAKTGGGSGYALAALFTFAMGVISLGGIWSMGLVKSRDADRGLAQHAVPRRPEVQMVEEAGADDQILRD